MNIDPGLVEGAISDRTPAVVAAHMYACPVEIGRLDKTCRDHGVFLVDGAAQVVGIGKDQRLLGTYGDAGILSFSQPKTLVAGGINARGVLLVGNPALINRMERLWQALPRGRYNRADGWQSLRDSLWGLYFSMPYYDWAELRRRWLGPPISELSCPATRIAPTSTALAFVSSTVSTNGWQGVDASQDFSTKNFSRYPMSGFRNINRTVT